MSAISEQAAGEHTQARRGASRLWDLLRHDVVCAVGAGTASPAVQQAEAGPRAVYLPGDPAPQRVRQVNDELGPDPVVAGCGGGRNAFELMESMIAAGAAGVCFADWLPSEQDGGPGGQVLVPTGQHIETLIAARLAADVYGVPSLIMARSAADSAALLTSDADERDHEFLTGERTADGYYRVRPGLYACVTRGLAFAPYADLLWLETPAPDLAAARAFANIIHSQYPDQLLAYHWSPSGGERLDEEPAARFQQQLAALGYRFQCVTPAGAPVPGEPVLELARG